jgi:hypothetical protein
MNESTFFNVEQVLTEKIAAEFIGRGKYQRTRRGLRQDRRASVGHGDRHQRPAVGFTEQQLASAVSTSR